MRVAAIALVAAALAGCAVAPSQPPKRTIAGPDHVTLAEQDARIELAPGARIHVRLASEKFAVAHRRWHITAVEGDAVRAYGNPWFAASHPFAAYAVRDPGNWIFDFDAVASGSAHVSFDFRRDDEPLSAASRHAAFDFVVR